MPRYFFDVLDSRSPADADGVELADIYVAQKEAVLLASELLRDLGAKFWNDGEWRLQVTDEARRILFVLKFSAEERVYREGEAPSASDP